MTLRHALEVLLETATTPEEVEVEYIAIYVERALRAEYRAGYADGKAIYEWISDANDPGGCPRCRTELTTTVHLTREQGENCGVTAGVAAMVEKS